jgi:hypothetical protein
MTETKKDIIDLIDKYNLWGEYWIPSKKTIKSYTPNLWYIKFHWEIWKICWDQEIKIRDLLDIIELEDKINKLKTNNK